MKSLPSRKKRTAYGAERLGFSKTKTFHTELIVDIQWETNDDTEFLHFIIGSETKKCLLISFAFMLFYFLLYVNFRQTKVNVTVHSSGLIVTTNDLAKYLTNITIIQITIKIYRTGKTYAKIRN